LKDDLIYNNTDCFEAFPFPAFSSTLDEAGKKYYEYRAALMVAEGQGLTKIFNRLSDPEESAPAIVTLRELHSEMDRVLLDAFGWDDIQPVCEFVPEFYEDDEDDENGHPRKKRYRYRWPDEIRDEVLARLLELNHQRAVEEGQALPSDIATVSTSGDRSKTTGKKKSETQNVGTTSLFAVGQEEK
jgi:hypothetical protein